MENRNELTSSDARTEKLFYADLLAGFLNATDVVSRDWLHTEVIVRLRDPDCRFVLITGKPGTGKTGLMVALADANPDWLRYFVRSDSTNALSGTDATSLLLRVGHQLAYRQPDLFNTGLLHADVEQNIETVVEGARAAGIVIGNLTVSPFRHTAFHVLQNVGTLSGDLIGVEIARANLEPRMLHPDAMARLSLIDPAEVLAKLRPEATIVVLIDALDEIGETSGSGSILDWLESGPELPRNIKVVVTSRRTEWLKSFCSARGEAVSEINLDDRLSQAHEDLKRFAGRLFENVALPVTLRPTNLQAIIEALASSADGNFAYAVAYSRALQAALSSDNEEETAELLSLKAFPRGLESLYATFIRKIRRRVEAMGRLDVSEPASPHAGHVDAWEGVGQRILGVLAVARAPLGLQKLMDFGRVRVRKSTAARVLRHFIPFLDESKDGFEFFHASVGSFLTSIQNDRYSDIALEPKEWHGLIVQDYRGRFAGTWLNCDPYGRKFLLDHTVGAGRQGDLDCLVEVLDLLTVAEPSSILAALPRVRSRRARDVARAYSHVAHLLRASPLNVRRSYLDLSLLQNGVPSDLAEGDRLDPRAPWRPLWAECYPALRRLSVSVHEEEVRAMAAGTLDGRQYVASGDNNGIVILTDAATGTQICAVPGRRIWSISSLCTCSSENGDSMLVIGDVEGTIECWNLNSLEKLWGMNGYHWSVRDLAIATAHGAAAVISCSEDAIQVNELRTGEPLENFMGGQLRIRTNIEGANCLARLGGEDSAIVLSGHQDGKIRKWDLNTGNCDAEIQVGNQEIWQLHVGQQGNAPAIVVAELGGAVRVLDGTTFKTKFQLETETKPNLIPRTAIGKLSSEEVVYSAHNRHLQAFSLVHGRCIAEVRVGIDVVALARSFGDDGPIVMIAGGGRSVQIIDEREIARFDDLMTAQTSLVTAIAALPTQGDLFACGYADGRLEIRDAGSGNRTGEEWTLPGAIRAIEMLDYHGALIFCCNYDGGLWVQCNDRVTIFADVDRRNKIMSAALGMNGELPVLAIGTDDGKLEAFTIGASISSVARNDSAHKWVSANLADQRVRPANIAALSFCASRDGLLLASAGWEDQVLAFRQWPSLDARTSVKLSGYCLRLCAPSGKSSGQLISTTMDLRCSFWDPEMGILLKECRDTRLSERDYPYESESLWYVDCALGRIAGRDHLAIGARDGIITIVDHESMDTKAVVSVGYGIWGRPLAFTSSGTIVVAGERGLTAIKLM
ncbi:WD40 repeat domain-containing protein [Sinorhizobium meliloti]|uniref:WD40 repeat domain-containing protein n=1 Tax=Rhizobium meliloti TaxID=382 RepID=UPI0023807BA2|nr:hypothetical protein [Sinorhizobium meliloti]MDE3819729.1 hypothetical protein [Sinorhizobium meliloti]